MARPFIFVLGIILLTSCRAYRIYPTEYRDFSNSDTKKKAFVLNPDLAKEYVIFKNADIFSLVDDSLAADVVKIRLLPMDRRLACGNGAFLTLFTVGQLPVLYTDRYFYKFEEISENMKTEKEFELQVATIVWFWNIFSSQKNFNKQAGQALLASYYKKSSS
jgi:hypothetical protein